MAYAYLVAKGLAEHKAWKDEEISYWLGFNSHDMWKAFVYEKETYERAIKKKRNRSNTKYPIGSFKMQDSWKNDLKTKLISRIEEVIRRK